jgi:hypothetical protein
LALAATTVGATSGCGGSDRTADTRPAPPLRADERTRLDDVERRLTSQCMRAHGYDLEAAIATRTRHAARSERRFPYGIDDVAWARRHGLGAPDGGRTGAPRARRATMPSREAAAFQRALSGDRRNVVEIRLPTGYTVGASRVGCAAAAQTRLYGDMPRWFRANTLVMNLSAEVARRVTTDPVFVERLRAWSRCVGDAGYAARSPQDMQERYLRRSAGLPPTRRRALEVRMGSAQARCVLRTGLASTGRRLARREQRRVVSTYRAAIQDQRRLARTALERVSRQPL